MCRGTRRRVVIPHRAAFLRPPPASHRTSQTCHIVSDRQKVKALEEPSNCSRWYLVNLVMPVIMRSGVLMRRCASCNLMHLNGEYNIKTIWWGISKLTVSNEQFTDSPIYTYLWITTYPPSTTVRSDQYLPNLTIQFCVIRDQWHLPVIRNTLWNGSLCYPSAKTWFCSDLMIFAQSSLFEAYLLDVAYLLDLENTHNTGISLELHRPSDQVSELLTY